MSNPNSVKSLTVMLDANRREVSRLADVVTTLAQKVRDAEAERDAWKKRFDRLLDCCRSVS